MSPRTRSIYLAARVGHFHFEHGHGAVGAVPPLITTGDLAVVTLGRGRGGAAWLTEGKGSIAGGGPRQRGPREPGG